MKTIERKGVGAANASEDFEQEFLRFRGLCREIAERVLNGDDDVDEAMHRSYVAAGSQRRKFRSDGELRRWLVRTVLNEALMILHEKESAAEASSQCIFWQTR
jgi:DNA-directed RNA polymerase specialized sigma24 family protein